MRRQILRNTIFNVIGRFWLIGTNLFLTPLMLSFLGQNRFAVWVLFGALSQYFLLLDFGLGSSLVKHFAQFRAKGDMESVNQAVTTMLCLYLSMGLVLSSVLWPVTGWLVHFLSLPQALLPEAIQAFHAGLIVLALMNPVILFDSLLKGFQRMELTNMILMAVSVPNVVGTYLVLRHGGGLLGVFLVAGSIYLLQLALLGFSSKRVFPGLQIRPSLLHWGVLKLLFGYGARFQVSRIAESISYHLDKVLLGLYAPIRYVTFYDLGSKVALILHDLPVTLFNAVFPAASQLAAQRDHQRLWLLCERGTKYLLLLSVPMLVGLWLTSPLILKAWLGHVSLEVRYAVLFLATGYWASISMGMVTTVGMGMGWMAPIMRAGALQCVLNLVLSLALILVFGYIGALIGTMVTLFVSNGYILVRFCRDFDRSVSHYLAMMLRIALSNAPPALASIMYLSWADQWVQGGGRGAALLALLGCICLYVAVYLAGIRWSGMFDDTDWGLLGDDLPLTRHLRMERL